ncbi:MAG TPA: alkaline phosphatase family protein [Pseudonocardiaceae bacterium]|nr:alkaline phosphatase family protein [Pseudonocardiaceae bacterium]
MTVVASGAGVNAAAASPSRPATRHVLVLSIDGLHQSDLAFYVKAHPASGLASLVHQGVDYRNAQTTFPSDSFPGMVAQFTGAGAGTSGIYYDDTYNHASLAPGTRDCATAQQGTEVAWTEAADRSQHPITLDAGQGITAIQADANFGVTAPIFPSPTPSPKRRVLRSKLLVGRTPIPRYHTMIHEPVERSTRHADRP